MRCRFDPWVRKIPWRRKWQATPDSFLEKSHGQRSLAGYSPWGHKDSDMTEQLNTHTHIHTWMQRAGFQNPVSSRPITLKRRMHSPLQPSPGVRVYTPACMLSRFQSCPTLYDPLNCSPPGSSVHGIHQARILEWVAIPFSRGSSQPRDQT